jgi:two-component system, OmpR family, KDP operon response regulator KdpE
MSGHRPGVLLVEDDHLLRDAFEILLDDAGYRVFTAGTAAAALDTVRKTRPDLVVLDLGLPDRPGLDVVRAIRQDSELAGIAVIALTGQVGAAEKEAALNAGCNRYLGKPAAPRELLETLSALAGA